MVVVKDKAPRRLLRVDRFPRARLFQRYHLATVFDHHLFRGEILLGDQSATLGQVKQPTSSLAKV